MKLSEIQLDYLKESFNIGVGRGARVLNSMLSSHISLSVPEIWMIDNGEKDFFPHFEDSVATVDLQFTGELTGTCKLLFPSDSALKLVRQVSGEPWLESDTDFDPMSEGILKEIGNIVLNSVIGVLSNNLGIHLHYTVPTFQENRVDELVNKTILDSNAMGLLARINFSIESMDVQGEVLIVFRMGSFTQLLNYIDKKLNA